MAAALLVAAFNLVKPDQPADLAGNGAPAAQPIENNPPAPAPPSKGLAVVPQPTKQEPVPEAANSPAADSVVLQPLSPEPPPPGPPSPPTSIADNQAPKSPVVPAPALPANSVVALVAKSSDDASQFIAIEKFEKLLAEQRIVLTPAGSQKVGGVRGNRNMAVDPNNRGVAAPSKGRPADKASGQRAYVIKGTQAEVQAALTAFKALSDDRAGRRRPVGDSEERSAIRRRALGGCSCCER
jgi:hypothetical protein